MGEKIEVKGVELLFTDAQSRFAELLAERVFVECEADIEYAWELRLGPENRFRVFYRVDVGGKEVRVLAVGEKIRNRLMVGGEEFEV